MCGIAGIIRKNSDHFDIKAKIIAMSTAIKHRGPDGEGFIFEENQKIIPYFNQPGSNFLHTELPYIPKLTVNEANSSPRLAFAHRRLSIIDLSESGHQPMCDQSKTYWITYNGEIYNYIELKETLKKLGHSFSSESDTEVVICAYKEWGTDCVKQFNGMWSFCIYDTQKQICFASRDRFGVKPFYYLNTASLFAFASEQKAFVRSGLLKVKINEKALHSYLINGLLENESSNFFEGVTELWPGHNLVYDLRNHSINTFCYYHLKNEVSLRNDELSESELIGRISSALENAIRLRLRSDVEVGTCLSGGIDSSALAVSISEITNQPLFCFTAIFKGEGINEEGFADLVAEKIKARYFKTEPSLQGFEKDVDDLIYSQDVPIWSTSTYAQYKVMELARQNGIKVVLDGQGADELFAGYHHHFMAKWNNLLSGNNYSKALKDIRDSNKTIPNAGVFFFKERIKQLYNPQRNKYGLFLKKDFVSLAEIKNPSGHFTNLNEVLIDDIYHSRLKSFLKCEDRCGMWHSVESRTPFSDDIELINLLFSFDGNKKIKNGISKHLLREAVKTKLPEKIYSRYDKKGFETPMQKWIEILKPKLLTEIKNAEFEFVDYKNLHAFNTSKQFDHKLLFKLFVLSRWKKIFLSTP